MEDILFIIILLAVFAFGYYAAVRFGKFMDKHYRGYQEPQKPGGKVYIAETGGKSAEAISKEVGAMLDSLPDGHEYGIIICQTADPRIIACLKESGCTIEYGLRQ